MEWNIEITASNLTPTIQNRDPGTVTSAAVKLFCVFKWSVRNHYKRREINRKHPCTIII